MAPVPSMWPETMWPPNRLSAAMARSRFTGLPGAITQVRRDDNALWYTVEASPALLRYIVEKGSIAMDGISLTVAAVEADRFSVSVIPHTAAVTALGRKRPGDVVNLETDIIGKYVEKLLRPAEPAAPRAGLSLEFLMENGF